MTDDRAAKSRGFIPALRDSATKTWVGNVVDLRLWQFLKNEPNEPFCLPEGGSQPGFPTSAALLRSINRRWFGGGTNRGQSQLPGLGDRHLTIANRFDRTLLPAVTNVELPTRRLKDPAGDIA